MKVHVKRVYDKAAKSDGYRVLVDRLWPRGVKKEEAHIDTWAKDLAPSDTLRKWFHEDPDKRFAEFQKKYREDLQGRKEEVRALIPKRATITLVTAAKDIENSHVPTIKKLIEELY